MKKVIAGAMAASLCLALGACSTEGGPGSSPEGDAPRVLNQVGWGGTTWNQNFNLFSPTGVSVTPGTAYIYEPLIRVNRIAAGEMMPYLAESWEFNDAGTELTFTLRDDVTWSDGEPFTSADVKFTWDLVLSGETPASYPFTSVETPDEHTVVVTYEEQSFQDLVGFSTRRIVPAHVWENQDVRTWTNPEPVGTGPATVSQFSPQQITFDIRDDWWGGESKGLDQLNMHAITGDATKSQIISGQVDYGTFGWANAQQEFVDLAPETNFYGFYPVGTADGLIFNVEQAPYNDVHVRRALRAAVDLETAAEIVAVGYGVPSEAALDPVVYADQLAPNSEHRYDPEYAQSELQAGGWTVSDGQLVGPDGQSHSLRYDVYQPYDEWVRTGTILADQWQRNLGLEVAVNQMADAPFSEASTTGNFGMLSSSPTGGSTPYQVFNSLGEETYVPLGEQAINNYGRWQNEEYNAIVTELAGIAPGSDDARARELSIRAQEILIDEAPFIATATAGWKAVINGQHWTNFPVPGEDDYAPNPTLPADAALTIMNIEYRE
ncbi:ABC transporter substrate-binding protein [Propioniciclava soli]|uniref:ABC transporter substrate-binding protein n=1 Tax=Propioniciclava soli TaxID=2775081 RepID=A0ABZ3CBD2_9ACTN|nr:ABC transporter substrate-binding protein [Propioniciclava soli]